MRVVILHNFYTRRVPSGENEAVESDIRLLEEAGHSVQLVAIEADEFLDGGLFRRTANGSQALARAGKNSLSRVLGSTTDILHVHNMFPISSASALRFVHDTPIPVVMTVHNYRFTCMAGTHLLRNNLCHKCQSLGSDRSGVVNGCYRNSRPQSALMYLQRSSVLPHLKRLDHYFALTEDHRKYLTDIVGVDEARVSVRGNTVTDRGMALPGMRAGFLFVGRLSDEKGIRLLLDVWEAISDPTYELVIAGAGPLEPLVTKAANSDRRISYVGQLSQDEVGEQMSRARALIVPSTCYEGLPRVVVEAMATGLPIISTNLGALGSLITRANGASVAPRVEDVKGAVERLAAMNVQEYFNVCHTARSTFEKEYSRDVSLGRLMSGYELAIEAKFREDKR